MYFIVVYIVGDYVIVVVGFRERERKGKGLVASAGKLELKINLQLAPGATENCHVGLLRGIAQNSHHSPENLPSL